LVTKLVISERVGVGRGGDATWGGTDREPLVMERLKMPFRRSL
jgi:hypothetical protein